MTPTLVWTKSGNNTRSVFPQTNRQDGFTLLELILVVSILALAATVIVPNLGALESRNFNAQIRQVNNLLNYARRLAVVNGQPSTATISVDPEAVAQPDSQIDFANQAGEWRSEGASIRFRDSTDQEIDIEGSLDIIFYPEGGSTGGTLLISNQNQRVSIDINPITGRISTDYADQL